MCDISNIIFVYGTIPCQVKNIDYTEKVQKAYRYRISTKMFGKVYGRICKHPVDDDKQMHTSQLDRDKYLHVLPNTANQNDKH